LAALTVYRLLASKDTHEFVGTHLFLVDRNTFDATVTSAQI
jgi:hypothetical protein